LWGGKSTMDMYLQIPEATTKDRMFLLVLDFLDSDKSRTVICLLILEAITMPVFFGRTQIQYREHKSKRWLSLFLNIHHIRSEPEEGKARGR